MLVETKTTLMASCCWIFQRSHFTLFIRHAFTLNGALQCAHFNSICVFHCSHKYYYCAFLIRIFCYFLLRTNRNTYKYISIEFFYSSNIQRNQLLYAQNSIILCVTKKLFLFQLRATGLLISEINLILLFLYFGIVLIFDFIL